MILPSAALTRSLLHKRLRLEERYDSSRHGPTDLFSVVEGALPMDVVIPMVLRGMGLYQRARNEYSCFVVKRIRWKIAGLPPAFSGFRLLHLSDLHPDIDPEFAPKLARVLRNISADACVITGDYQDNPSVSHEGAIAAMRIIVDSFHWPVYAIPGNHDRLALLDAIAQMGVHFLVNNTVSIKSKGDTIHIAGIDDPHYFKTHDLSAVSGDGFRILLSHSPETYREAANLGFAFALSGHTHAGQLRLPGIGAIVKRADVPRAMVWGAWREKAMVGFTTAGTGATGCPVRLNCPSEIIVHELFA